MIKNRYNDIKTQKHIFRVILKLKSSRAFAMLRRDFDINFILLRKFMARHA